MPFFEFTISNVMFVAGVTLALAILLRRYWKYQGKLKKQKKKKAGPPLRTVKAYTKPAATPMADAPAEVLRWQVEMEDRARELNAILDSKMAALQAITARAIAERERLEQAIQKATRFTPSELRNKGYEEIADIVEFPPAVFPQAIADDARQAVYALIDKGYSVQETADRTGMASGDVELILSSRAAG